MKSNEPFIVNGIDLNDHDLCTSAMTVPEAVAFIDAHGTLNDETADKYQDVNYNLWVAAKRLVQRLDEPPYNNPPAKETVIPVRAEVEIVCTLKEVKVGK